MSIQSANGIYSPEDRQLIQVEVSALVDEVDRIASQAEFNRFKVLTGEFSKVNPKASMWFHMGANQNQRERVYIGTMTAAAFKIKEAEGTDRYPLALQGEPTRQSECLTALQRLSKQRADLGAYYNRLELAAKGLMTLMKTSRRLNPGSGTLIWPKRWWTSPRSVLVHSGTAMLAQANLQPQSILRLLG